MTPRLADVVGDEMAAIGAHRDFRVGAPVVETMRRGDDPLRARLLAPACLALSRLAGSSGPNQRQVSFIGFSVRRRVHIIEWMAAPRLAAIRGKPKTAPRMKTRAKWMANAPIATAPT